MNPLFLFGKATLGSVSPHFHSWLISEGLFYTTFVCFDDFHSPSRAHNLPANMDPVSSIGLVGSVVGIVDVITKSVAHLSGLQSSYKIADLKVRLLVGQLSTLKAALDQIASLIDSRPGIPRDEKLVNDLSIALTCVKAVILAIDTRLSDLQIRDDNLGLKTLSKVGFVWDEQTINDYLSLLNNQVNALNLFLTALQW
jgi:hypothetical protein